MKVRHGFKRTVLTGTLLVGFALIVWTQSLQPPPGNDPLALTNASVINVRNGQISRGTTIVLRNGMIESVGTAAPSSGMRVIDLKNKYVLPGLIDARSKRRCGRTGRDRLRVIGYAHPCRSKRFLPIRRSHRPRPD